MCILSTLAIDHYINAKPMNQMAFYYFTIVTEIFIYFTYLKKCLCLPYIHPWKYFSTVKLKILNVVSQNPISG